MASIIIPIDKPDAYELMAWAHDSSGYAILTPVRLNLTELQDNVVLRVVDPREGLDWQPIHTSTLVTTFATLLSDENEVYIKPCLRSSLVEYFTDGIQLVKDQELDLGTAEAVLIQTKHLVTATIDGVVQTIDQVKVVYSELQTIPTYWESAAGYYTRDDHYIHGPEYTQTTQLPDNCLRVFVKITAVTHLSMGYHYNNLPWASTVDIVLDTGQSIWRAIGFGYSEDYNAGLFVAYCYGDYEISDVLYERY